MSPLARWATIIASLTLTAPLVVSRLVEYILKSTNPDNVDVSNGLAYLRPILVTIIVGIIVVAIAAAAMCVMVRRADGPGAATLPATVLGVQIAFVVVLLILGAMVNGLVSG